MSNRSISEHCHKLAKTPEGFADRYGDVLTTDHRQISHYHGNSENWKNEINLNYLIIRQIYQRRYLDDDLIKSKMDSFFLFKFYSNLFLTFLLTTFNATQTLWFINT